MSADFKEFFSPNAILLAWNRYIRTGQKDAKDYFGIRAFGTKLNENIKRLSDSILDGKLTPRHPPKFYRPKSSGMQRTVTILPVEDALVYQAVANAVATRSFDILTENNDFVFGSVLHDEVAAGVGTLKMKDAELFFFKPYPLLYKEFSESVNKSIKEDKVEYKCKTDITGFFDCIPHYNLLSMLADEHQVAEDVLDLMADCLNAWCGTREGSTPGVGIPQSTDASAFFANVFLHELDNRIKNFGLPYYRYMNDIRIYGYSHEYLMRVLIDVDQYLKRHALSLNAKKTSIEKMTAENEQDSLILFEYSGEEQPDSYSDDVLDFEAMAAQDGSGYEAREIDTQDSYSDEVRVACRDELEYVSAEVTRMVDLARGGEVDLSARSIERKFISLGFRFRQARNVLEDMDTKPPDLDGKVLDAWFFLLEHYFWRADQFCWVLALFKENDLVKKRLFEIVEKHSAYEWVRHHIYQCLTIGQKFSTRELREIFRMLDMEISWYGKRNLYFLLLKHCKNKQLFRSILSKLGREGDPVLKREVLSFAKHWEAQGVPLKQLMEALGLA